VTGSPITHAEQAGWQRRAASVLAAILDAHRGLPVIAWTVAPAGSALLGQVNSLASADEVRHRFHAWRAALGLSEHSETACAGQTARLRAWGYRNRVRVVLVASVFDDGGQVIR
jgi:hypothetical protein